MLDEPLITEPLENPWFELNSADALQSVGTAFRVGQIVQNRWRAPFSNTINGNPVFTLSGSSTSDSAEGFWDFDSNSSLLEFNIERFGLDFPDALRNLEISGTWNATLRTDVDGSSDSGDSSDSDGTTTTPEPSSVLVLFGLGIFGTMLMSRRNNIYHLD